MLIEKHPIYPIRAPEAPTAVTQNTIHLAIVYRQTELAIEPNLMKCLRLVKVFREKYKRQTVWPIVVLPLQSATFSLVLFSGSKRIVNSPRHHPLVENGVPPAAHRALIGSINYTSVEMVENSSSSLASEKPPIRCHLPWRPFVELGFMLHPTLAYNSLEQASSSLPSSFSDALNNG